MAGPRESSRTTSEPPGSYELSWLFPLKQGREAESSYELSNELGGSDMVRELSREPAMFQIGLQGEALKDVNDNRVALLEDGYSSTHNSWHGATL